MIGDAEKVSENAYLSASVSIETSLMATILQTFSVNHSLSYFPYSSLHIFSQTFQRYVWNVMFSQTRNIWES